MKYLCENDSAEKTVIGVQVENEPGIIEGAKRDYGKESEAAFNSSVPEGLLNVIKNSQDSYEYDVWIKNGSKMTGTWPQVFGISADEFYSAYDIARYIDGIVAEGKKVYNIPMYINVWLDRGGWDIPGMNYPSGGAVTKTLNIWKYAAPHIDLIAPDIYWQSPKDYIFFSNTYSRSDNPLFIPESSYAEGNAKNMFYAIADYNAIGYHIFGVEDIIDDDGMPRKGAKAIIGSFNALSSALPLLIRYQGTGRVHAVAQEEYLPEQKFEMGEYIGLVSYFSNDINGESMNQNIGWTDYHHHMHFQADDIKCERGRGLVIQSGENEFYALGGGYKIVFQKKETIEKALSSSYMSGPINTRNINYISVEEGYFDCSDNWVTTRKRSGDENDFGVWVMPDNGVVKIVLSE